MRKLRKNVCDYGSSPGTSFTVLGAGIGGDRSIVLSTIVGKGGLAESPKTRGGPHRIESQLIEVHLNQLSMQVWCVISFN